MNPNTPDEATFVSAEDLRRTISFREGSDMRNQFIVKVRGDVSARKYLAIVHEVERGNRELHREDYIVNPREHPYEPFRSIPVNNIEELEHAVERMGNKFNCLIVPEGWDTYQAIAGRARELDVQVDTWSRN